ncbi:PhoP family transcriptional regulator [Pontibacillus halophilus JSM 076056 = DSM 19796]|uniref:PhoP family transcriptional regulator n=1 Tax=Pontibacillus halophilus JSM 076056 = DSM 19796 TaxID=1385510 RepID=A0A0A5GS14_9BACI|nr:response regulator transcription factor [Pontibacillus halophilus]KGX94003.1 PhoP family transcriptional regulator [Pontibacillus halophilus JSM 076056 = DSM 19796]
MSYTVLVAEDDENIIDVCRRYLEREGYEVIIARDGEEAIERWQKDRPDAVILDIMMPFKSGLDVAEEIRFADDIPVILLTALSQEKDKLFGLSIGVDDYMTKPFSPRELVLRLKNVMRRYERTPQSSSDDVSFGAFHMNQKQRRLLKDEAVIETTVKEFDLLWFLVKNESQVFSRSQLLERIWGYDYEGDTNTINVHIRRLREKIEPDPANPVYLKTVWGIGYKFEGRM